MRAPEMRVGKGEKICDICNSTLSSRWTEHLHCAECSIRPLILLGGIACMGDPNGEGSWLYQCFECKQCYLVE
jgi:hypothetical protein